MFCANIKMAGHVKDVMPNHDADVALLFEKYTVEEIRDIEKKTRQNIEKKKEDLRQMVGERYRDLIEAADTITDMKKSADNVTHSIARIQELCSSLKRPSMSIKADGYSASKETGRKSQQRMLFATAVNLKLIMDMPERIWSALDLKQYLLATRLYLLARHIYNTVQLDPSSAAVVGHFPILARQWASICHFKAAILQYCRACLKDPAASDQVVSECLGSIFLLEDQSMEQVFNEFLCARAEAVHQLFVIDNSEMSVKSQVCDVIYLIVTTVYQIYSIFYLDESLDDSNDSNKLVGCNMLVTLLKAATSKSESGAIIGNDSVSAQSRQYLSKVVCDFRPSPRHSIAPVSLQVITASSKDFLERCVVNVQDGLAKVLNYITTVKGLTTIRDELWNLLKNDERLMMWDLICMNIFGRHVRIWSELTKQIFVRRIEELLRCQFDSAVVTGKAQITKVLSDLSNIDDRMILWERDLSSYVWSENVFDMPSSAGSSVSKLQCESNALMMKAHGYTPAIQSLCRGLDQRLKALLDDAVCYIQVTGNHNSADNSPFDRFEDREKLQKFVQTACEDCIFKQLEFLHQQLALSKQQLMDCNDKASSQVIIHRILLMGRYSSALCDLSPHLHLCMSCLIGDESALPVIARSASKKTLQSRTLPKSTENSCWTSVRDKLIKFSHDTFGVWVEHACNVAVSQFRSTLCDETSQSFLTYGTQWDCIEIEEETEDNKKIKSTIRVPMQASWYTQTMLYNVCEDINQMGGQAVHRLRIHHQLPNLYLFDSFARMVLATKLDLLTSSLQSLVRRLTEGILTAYEQLLSNNRTSALSQTRSLQLIFDLKFLMNILGHKEDSEVAAGNSSKRLQNITERLESFVDPFDLDVFSPYIQNHLLRQSQRSSVLFGLLISTERRLLSGAAYTSLPVIGTQQDQHNVLPLASCQNRFALLPLSVQASSTSGMQPILQAPKSKVALPAAVSSISNATLVRSGSIQPARNSSSSFLEQMSTMWFSGGK